MNLEQELHTVFVSESERRAAPPVDLAGMMTRGKIRRRRRTTLRAGVAAAVVAVIGFGAFALVDGRNPNAPQPASNPASLANTSPSTPIQTFPQSGPIDAGTYLVTGYPVPFKITVPDGWETVFGDGLGKDDPDLPDSWNATVLFWPASYVPTDACAWRGALVQVDPTAKAFVEAMTAQASTVTTPPVKVMVGDYSGFEFDYAVESDVDITDCDDGKICVYSEVAHACGNGREYSNVGERETYRVVDLNGERAVIAVGQSHKSMDPALTKEARAIFDSIKFVRPDK